MGFYPQRLSRVVGAAGRTDARICLVGEALGAQEEKMGVPFVGAAGGVLDQCLHSAALIRSDLYITNLVKVKPPGNNISPYYKESKQGKIGSFTDLGMAACESLWKELESVSANVIVPLGKPAMLACLGTDKVSQLRGYVFTGRDELHGRKVIPTYHPAATLRGQYIWRYYISNDLAKARRESTSAKVDRPEREILWPDTFKEACEWLDFFASCSRLSVDIEVINFEVSCICLADSPARSMSFPMYWSPEPKWSVQEEAHLWKLLAGILGDPDITKIFQNGIFDIQFLMTRCGVHVKPPIEDTMIAHSIMFPDMLKGLGFLGSLYCGSQEYWKSMVRFTNIKGDA